jgi:hypothetical protein
MPKLTGNFDAAGEESRELLVRAGQSYVLSLTPDPSLTGSIQLLARDDSPAASSVLRTFTDTLALTEYKNETGKDQYLRLRCVDLDEGEPEDVDYVLQSLIGGNRVLLNTAAKAGATAGWAVNAAGNTGILATLAAGRTANTLVVPVAGLNVGDVIAGYYPVGQVESAGNTASITFELRKLTAAAADVVDASVATTGAVAFTADGILGRITSFAENVNATVADGESYYFLVTATTGASTDIALQGIMLQTANGVH